MVCVAAFLAWSCLLSPAYGQDGTNLLRDGDFEAATSQAWRSIPGDFEARPDTTTAHEGERSFRLARDPSSSSEFAAMAQAIDAVPLRDKTVRFRAAARVMGGGAGSSAGLWLRVDREGAARGFFDNMSARPIRSSDWSVYEIVGPVADDATKLTVGFLLNGAGPAWIDTASLETVSVATDEGDADPLTAREVDNLTAFARLYGYVRWFSPYSEPNDIRWDQIATDGAIAAARADSPQALAAILRIWFEPMAPELAVSTQAIGSDPRTRAGGETDLVRWRHEGVDFANPAYRSERVSADRVETWQADLGSGLFVSLPLTAPRTAVSGGTRPVGAQAARQGGDDRATRLGATIIAWNVFQHFYPYFEDGGESWRSAIGDRLEAAAKASEAEAFRAVLQSMVADLDDGHGEVGPETEDYRLPLLWQWIENALVVTAVVRDADHGVAVGDLIVAIDGRPVERLLEDESAYVSASTDAYRLWRAAEALRGRTTSRPLTLQVQGADGVQRDVPVTPVARRRLEGVLREDRPAPVTWFPQGAWYFDLTRLDDRRLDEALRRVRPDQPVIFDLRGYPHGIAPDFLGRLTRDPVGTPPFLIPVSGFPDGQAREWKRVGWQVQPVSPLLRGRIAFLTDERAISYTETLLAIVRGHGLADIVGEPTAGTNRNVNPFSLPGSHRVVWTGMKVVNHDGSDLAGHGVQPTVPATATIAGVRGRRDEVLERGIEVVTQRTRPAGPSPHPAAD